MIRPALAFLSMLPLCAADAYLFTSFRQNGQTGVFLALSDDGRTWTPLKNNQPWIAPQHESMLMRDPHLSQGPDGVWHLVWTWGWTSKDTGGKARLGHSSSTDLISWSPQEEVVVFPESVDARNVWAPEAVWDPSGKQWIIIWASTIPGQFPDDGNSGNGRYNHRMYATTTKDWKTFTPSKIWFDPGFNVIDATLARDGKRWVMVFKDERDNPPRKRLRLAFADSPAGPWTGVTEPFTRDWVEGPSAVRIGDEWWIYFEHYRNPQHYGALKTKDWKTFEDVTGQLNFPHDHKHGTVVKIPAALATKLRSVQ